MYAVRLPAKDFLFDEIQHLLIRPVGYPSRKPIIMFNDLMCQAASWQKRSRVAAKVERHQGYLFPRVDLIVTNMNAKALSVIRFYNRRGIAEQWIKEGKYAPNWSRLSCKHFTRIR